MLHLATLYRIINLYAHNAHNLTYGNTFLQDHEFFAEIYALLDNYYDDVIERHVGITGESIDLCLIIKDAYGILEKLDDGYYKNILVLLNESLKMIDELNKSDTISVGTQNLIQGQADNIEVLIYKINQRLK